jgi:hypothetical protein
MKALPVAQSTRYADRQLNRPLINAHLWPGRRFFFVMKVSGW